MCSLLTHTVQQHTSDLLETTSITYHSTDNTTKSQQARPKISPLPSLTAIYNKFLRKKGARPRMNSIRSPRILSQTFKTESVLQFNSRQSSMQICSVALFSDTFIHFCLSNESGHSLFVLYVEVNLQLLKNTSLNSTGYLLVLPKCPTTFYSVFHDTQNFTWTHQVMPLPN